MESNKKRVNCRKCKYFYVTWDKKFPYGCKYMGFKTSNMPSVAVKKQSGEECLAFLSNETKNDNDKKKVYI